jgi:hypothetical protein
MNLRAKCVNTKCPAYGLQKSVAVGQMLGYGAKNDRVKCPACGELMQTTQSINVSTGKRATKRPVGRRIPGRTLGTKRTAKRTTKRVYKRGGGKRA